MKLFVTYPRTSLAFTSWLVQGLQPLLDAEIFVEFGAMDESAFETTPLRNVYESDAVLLVVTDQTFASNSIHRPDDRVQREICDALTHNKPLLLACQDGLRLPDGLPEAMRTLYQLPTIDFNPGYFKVSLYQLAILIAQSSTIDLCQPITLPSPEELARPLTHSNNTLLSEATALAEIGLYQEAIKRLKVLRDRGYGSKSNYGVLDELIANIEHERQLEDYFLSAGKYYDEIALLAQNNPSRARNLYGQFQQQYADFPFDPAQLEVKLGASPMEWIDIPKGNVTLQKNLYTATDRVVSVPAYTIARYPVTNAEYARFVEAGGYADRRWWTREGWQFRESERKLTPLFWQANRFKLDHPVVGVSWYEAIAYCQWLSHELSEVIMLPTDEQWLRAAQGDENLLFPWGNEFDRLRSNFNNISTTPVSHYKKLGASSFGVVDMIGNVWEWCLTASESGSIDLFGRDERIIHGGSWMENASSKRKPRGTGCDPTTAGEDVGFRCTRSLLGY